MIKRTDKNNYLNIMELESFFFKKLLTKSNGKRTPPKKDGISVNSRKTPINTVSNFNK